MVTKPALQGLAAAASFLLSLSSIASDYAVAASTTTIADPLWGRVVETWARRHSAKVIPYVDDPADGLPEIRAAKPRIVCFVATPAEATVALSFRVNRMIDHVDQDPYPDFRYGILTGLNADDAMRALNTPSPLVIRRVLGTTEFAMECVQEGTWFDEFKSGHGFRKTAYLGPREFNGTNDTTSAIASALLKDAPDAFICSGKSTARELEIGFFFEGGRFRSQGGNLFAVDTKGQETAIRSENPKILIPTTSPEILNIDGPDALALAWMHSAGVRQMPGHASGLLFGYSAWGILDYFVEQPGRFTLAEAFLANRIALIDRLHRFFPSIANIIKIEDADIDLEKPEPFKLDPQAEREGLDHPDGLGLFVDRDWYAFYGDPAWEARMASGPCRWKQELRREGEDYVFEIHPLQGQRTFEPVNMNGGRNRGGRPILEFLPERIGPATVTQGAEWNPVIADDFVLVPMPKPRSKIRDIIIRFKATPAPANGVIH